jgi:uncharacterized membrane protein
MIALIFFYLLFPALVIFACTKSAFCNKIGSVLICYVVGAFLGNIGILPVTAAGIQDTLSSASVAIALPLLLFSMDVKAWIQMAGKAIVSMIGATIIIAAVAGLGSLWMAERVPEAWKLAGLAVGVYTGGTPNMAAIKTALDVDPSTYLIMHTYDMLISLIYIIFCITIAQRLLHRFLPKFRQTAGAGAFSREMETEDINSYKNICTLRILKGLVPALLLSLVILGTAVALAGLIPRTYATAVTILLITTLGIGASFLPRIRQIEKTFQLGMYMILVFCLVVGSMARVQDLVQINWLLLGYIGFCVFGSFFLHALFCRLMNIDTDTFIITSTAAICSPPFVPMVAGALNNRQIILSGLTTGIIGYAIGNYLGISIAYLVRAVTG